MRAPRSPLRRNFLAFLCCLMTLLPSAASTAGSIVDIEYLIFRLDASNTATRHQGTRQAALIALTEISAGNMPFGKGHALVTKPSVLSPAKTRLVGASRYRVVLHAIAKGDGSGNFAPVRFVLKSQKTGRETDLRALFQLSGTQTLRLQTSILYRPKSPESAIQTDRKKRAATPETTAWVIRDTRRITLGEIHYLDHPAFGVLVVARAAG